MADIASLLSGGNPATAAVAGALGEGPSSATSGPATSGGKVINVAAPPSRFGLNLHNPQTLIIAAVALVVVFALLKRAKVVKL